MATITFTTELDTETGVETITVPATTEDGVEAGVLKRYPEQDRWDAYFRREFPADPVDGTGAESVLFFVGCYADRAEGMTVVQRMHHKHQDAVAEMMSRM